MKRKRPATVSDQLYVGDNKVVAFEFPFGKDVIRTGDKIKIRNQRGTYRFYKIVHHTELDVTWVDVMNVDTGQWHSFYIDRVKTLIKPKRSYRKRVNQ
jgi:hypothetical protein